MAFGTGAHPTTSLCIQMIERYLTPGDSMLDVGTGSGILMIAAEKLGAGSVWGIDVDATAVKIAQENMMLNQIDAHKYKLIAGNLVDRVDRQFNVVVANILSEVILKLLESIPTVLVGGGIFICSGIISENKDTVVQKMIALKFEILEVGIRDSWVCIVGKKEKN
jgi:ribosomal protein L11 methyltransferase